MSIPGLGHEAASEMSEHTESIRQLGTHRKLVSQTEQLTLDATLALDAIIVPASRPAQNLEQAITLARAADCALLILCSQKLEPAQVHQLLGERSFNGAIVVKLPKDYRHELLEFRALESIRGDLPKACSSYVTDLSTKRNVGLLLARMVGWRRIFFLDDDIRDISHLDLQSTVSMLRAFPAAGMRVNSFPDNSVACHAHRATRGLQDVFVTGAALAVDGQKNSGFFPDIYNEDWLFFYDDARTGRLGSSGLKATQLRYDPFADAQRAAWQEFGDVLAEGLYALLDHGQGVEYATREYWVDFLYGRRRFLEAIIDRAGTARPEIREQLLRSVEAALKCSITIEPKTLERYVRLWRRDLRDWERRVAGIGQTRSLEVALKELQLELPAGGWISDPALPAQEGLTEEPPTVPFTAPDYFNLFRPSANNDGRRVPNRGKRGGRAKHVGVLSHHGSPGLREGGLLASARRAFWPGRGRASMESSPPPDTQPTEPACSGAPV